MRVQDPRGGSFAIPLADPAFPSGPYHFVDSEPFVITCETDVDAASSTPAASGHEPSIVEALCNCILGDRAEPPAGDWPPRSVAELMQHAPCAAGARSLIEQGLGALDAAVMEDTGLGFAQLERPRQLAALFRLEAGGPALSQEQAETFIDTFLALAAQAYLGDGFAQEPR